MAVARVGRAGLLYAAVGRELRERRRKAGLQQGELAEAVSLSRSSIANAEAGRQALPIHHLVEIAEALGTTAAEVLSAAEAKLSSAPPAPTRELPKAVVAFLERAAGARR
jgi:transcriptional regulator with XRE-family HTH domain